METRNLTWGQSLKISGYNLKFKALSYLEQSNPTQILPNFQQIFLLGEKYTANPDNRKIFSTTPWITYRSGFNQVKDKKGHSYVTDAGWGCMIRAGQMYFAQILKKHLKLEQKEEIYELMKLFDDCDQTSMFSIQNIMRLAKEEYQLQPGEWYNPSQISFILNDLFSSQTPNPYSKTLASMVMNNSSLLFDQLVMKMTNKQKLCDCKKKYAVCYECDKLDVSISIIIMCRIGLDQPQPKYLKVVSRIMQLCHFQGFIGGKPGKALYVLGKHSKRFIYLDPHMPQTAVNKSNFEKQKQTYFCNTFRSCKSKQIDPSMGIAFYLRELKNVDQLYENMMTLKKQFQQDFFLFVSLQTPECMKPGYKPDLDMFQIYSDEQTKQNNTDNQIKQKQQKIFEQQKNQSKQEQ